MIKLAQLANHLKTARLQTLSAATGLTMVVASLGAQAQVSDAEAIDDSARTNLVLSEMMMLACEGEEATTITCEPALAFSQELEARVSEALDLNDDLEMSAYNIGAVLREQRDLLVEYDALYRATEALVLRLVNARAQDRDEIGSLSTARAGLEQDLIRSREAADIASERVALIEREIAHLSELVVDRELEIGRLGAQLQLASVQSDEELVALRLALTDAETNLALLRDDLSARDGRIEALEQELALAAEEREALTDNLALERSSRLETEAHLVAAQDQLRLIQEALDAALLERDAVTASLSEQVSHVEVLRAQVSELEAAQSDNRARIAQLTEEIAALQSDLGQALAERDEAQANWTAAHLAHQAAEQALEDANQIIAELRAELDAAGLELSRINAELAAQT